MKLCTRAYIRTCIHTVIRAYIHSIHKQNIYVHEHFSACTYALYSIIEEVIYSLRCDYVRTCLSHGSHPPPSLSHHNISFSPSFPSFLIVIISFLPFSSQHFLFSLLPFLSHHYISSIIGCISHLIKRVILTYLPTCLH